jgi:hypothetical protein
MWVVGRGSPVAGRSAGRGAGDLLAAWLFFSGHEDLGAGLVPREHRLAVQQHDGHGGGREQVVLQGWASGQAGLFIWKWNSAAIRMLPLAALNMGVMRTDRASTPMT